MVRPALWFLLAFSLVLFAGSRPALAETHAEKVFGKWERVSIENVLKPVREFEYGNSSMGSVTREYRTHQTEDRRTTSGEPPRSRSAAPEQVAGLNQPPERR